MNSDNFIFHLGLITNLTYIAVAIAVPVGWSGSEQHPMTPSAATASATSTDRSKGTDKQQDRGKAS